MLVLGFLTLLSGLARGLAATALIWVVSGLGTWLVSASNTVTVGASGLIFGWLVYLIVRGYFTRRPGQVVLGVVLLLVYGTALVGVFPGRAGVSWQGHLFGVLGGALAALWLSPRPQGPGSARPFPGRYADGGRPTARSRRSRS